MTDATRSLLNSIFAAGDRGSFSQRFVDNLADDLVWTVTGSSPLSGVYRGKQEYLNGVMKPVHDHLAASVRPEVQRILVDGDRAAVQFETHDIHGKNGSDFSMQYCWVMKVAEGRISEVTAFLDQKKLADLLA